MTCLTRKSATSAREMNPKRQSACIDEHAIGLCARAGGQDGRTNNCPIKPASPYDPLLRVLVGVNTPKDQAESRVVEESSMATAVAGSETGHANQAFYCARFHRIDEDTGGGGKQACSAEDQLRGWRDAERLNDCLNARQRTRLLKGLTGDQPQS